MIYNFEVTYSSFWHFTIESILPIIDNLPKMQKGDIIIVPDFKIYPIDLVRRILKDFEVVQKTPDLTNYHFSYLREVNRSEQVKKLCIKLLSYINKKEVKSPSIYMNFRLHNRRWLPLDNIQKLIDNLKGEYTILLSLNPKWEKTSPNGKVNEVPDIVGATLIYDLPYEEQLSYAVSANYSIYTNGAGMIFPQIVELPSIMITPCLYTEQWVIDILDNYRGRIKVLSDKLPLLGENKESLWNNDITKVTVEEVINAFKSIRI